MKLKEIYLNNKLAISFEVFPVENQSSLMEELSILKKYSPSFISLTCNAGGKDNMSIDLISNIIKTGFDVMPHLTCISSKEKDIAILLDKFERLKIENILALRGDIPDNADITSCEFKHANELVDYITKNAEFSVGVAGYPEGHIESPGLDIDIKFLKNKVDCGADVIFTQLFFDNDKFYKFVDTAHSGGISQEIIPGIMPVISKKQIDKMTKLAKITVPKILSNALEKYNADDLVKFGIDYSSKQCEKLIEFGVKGLHFFTLNKSYSTSKILENIRR